MSKPTLLKPGDIPQRDILILVMFMVATLGLYSLYLLYQWSDEVNALLGRKKFDPLVVVLVSVLTCGMGGIIYECVFAYDVSDISVAQGLVDRIDNLPTWVILCNCIAIPIILFTYGIVISFLLGTFATVLIQNELNKLASV